MKKSAIIFEYCEINGEWNQLESKAETGDWLLTRDNDEQLVRELRDALSEEPDPDEEGEDAFYWELQGIAHLPRVTVAEFRSGRGHLSVMMIDWARN